MAPLVGLIVSYLAGGIPAAYVAGRVFRGIDLRHHGSGNLGATNVYRVMGWKIATLVMAFDVAKGALPVYVLAPWASNVYTSYWALAYGVAAIAGHVRSPYLGWKSGGKGVATAAGVFLALALLPTLIAVGVWAVVLAISGYVSLASLAAATTLPIAVGVTDGVRTPVFAVSVIVGLFVFWTHRGNIQRLRRGQEHRFGKRKAAA